MLSISPAFANSINLSIVFLGTLKGLYSPSTTNSECSGGAKPIIPRWQPQSDIQRNSEKITLRHFVHFLERIKSPSLLFLLILPQLPPFFHPPLHINRASTRKTTPPVFAPCIGERTNGKQFGCGHTPKFLLGRGPAKMLVGEPPQTRLFGTKCPKEVGCVTAAIASVPYQCARP